MPPEEFNPFDELPANDSESDVAVILTRLGWSSFLSLGDSDSDLCLQTWRRTTKHGNTEYMAEVSDVNEAGPFIRMDSFVELMDLMTRWAPAIQAASVVAVLTEAREYGLSDSGVVEVVAAKAAFGAGSGVERLQSWQRNRDQRQRL